MYSVTVHKRGASQPSCIRGSTLLSQKPQQERTKAATFFFCLFVWLVDFSHTKQQLLLSIHKSCELFCTVRLVFSYTDSVVDDHSSSRFTDNTYPTQQASLSHWRNSIQLIYNITQISFSLVRIIFFSSLLYYSDNKRGASPTHFQHNTKIYVTVQLLFTLSYAHRYTRNY